MKLLPNTIDGLTWGLENFDGIEFDFRLTKDNRLVIFHDPMLKGGQAIAELKVKKIKLLGIPLLSDFFQHEKAVHLYKQNKTSWIELKTNCLKKQSIDEKNAFDLHHELIKEIETHNIPKKSIRILSFSTVLLKPFVDENEFHTYSIILPINEFNQRFYCVSSNKICS